MDVKEKQKERKRLRKEGRIKGRTEKKNVYGGGVSRNGKRRKHKKERTVK
jgi:hypothetical protein